ncbi:MAG: glycosyltransferase family 4 protein [Alphaproteobacteria bacterium]|nr:glycosyltransferase family 4 protein [Alphaproteobacteria bacterium]
MTAPPADLHFIHPGPVTRRTGGTIYDRRVIDTLRDGGLDVVLHELDGDFPHCGAATEDAAGRLLAAFPAGARVVADGLALPAFRLSLAAHAGRLRFAALVHHPLADETGLTAADRRRLFDIEQEALRHADAVIVPSAAMRRRLADFDVPAERVFVVPPGTDPAPRATGGASDGLTLLCVASVTPRKGHRTLLAALDRCRDLDWRLICAGPTGLDAACWTQVQNAVARHGLGDRVSFTGTRTGRSLEALYDGADLFVLASAYEGYGMAFAEALARGLPVIASGAGAVAETVPEAAGCLVPVGDAGALAAALRGLMADPALRRAKADAAWAAGRALPDWPEAARRFAAALGFE